MDLDVEYERDNGKRLVGFRVVVLPGNETTMTRLCTNLPRTPFSLDLISRLYRFRWQIGKPISTRRVAMCAGHIIDQIVTAARLHHPRP